MPAEREGHRHVALLRGINLGRNRRIGMAPLRAALTERGHRDVRTLLQSGNVVLTADEADPHAVAAAVRAAIAEDFGFDVPTVVRSAEELAEVVAGDPFAGVATNGSQYLVTFFEPAPRPDALDGIDAAAFLPERFVLAGRTLYVWHAGGLQHSRLAAEIERLRLPVTATARNWNTVTKLLELART